MIWDLLVLAQSYAVELAAVVVLVSFVGMVVNIVIRDVQPPPRDTTRAGNPTRKRSYLP